MTYFLDADDKIFYWSVKQRKFEESEDWRKSPWRTERRMTRKKNF